ncbi:MAG: PAS domain S-box protein [Candidatus Ozemobacteraceae bacterium]
MKEPFRTNQELLDENYLLMRRIEELEQSEAKRKQAEDALKASESLLRTMAENYPNSYISIIEKDLTVGFTSGQELKKQNQDPSQFLGRTLEQIFGEHAPFVRDKYLKTFDGAETQFELFINNQCQCYRTVPVVNQNGRITRILAVVENITKRKQVEEALRKNEEDLKESQRIARVGSWHLNIANNQVVWSDELYRMYGFDPALPPPIYSEHQNLFTTVSWARLSTALAHTIETGSPYELELETLRKDGSNGWMWVFGKAILDASGKTVELMGVAQDITERKRADVALRESELKYSSLFNSMLEGFALHEIICDEAGEAVDYRFLDMNPAFEKLTGLKKTDVVGKTVLTVLPETESIWIEKYGRVALSGEPISFENYSTSLKRYYHVVAFCPMKNKFAVIFTDITEIKQVEAALSAEKERLAVTLRSIGDGVITTDIQGNVVIMNKVAEKLTGWLQSEAQGKPLATVFRIVNEGTRLPCENPAEKVLATGGIIELANHTLLISRDGTERVIADSGAPIMDQGSVTIGVVLVFRDMTEKQKLFDVLQRTDKLASLGVLAGGIAHDFNNMLAGVFGYIDLARESTTDQTVSEYLDKSMGVFSRARDLTQQLLTFSKGGTPLRKTSELGPLIRESASFALSGSKIACDYAIAKDLWLADFDKNQIGQVIDNLVINAQQAMPLGGRIVISAKNIVIKGGENRFLKAGMFIKLSITDTGIGIPPDLLKCIFDPFFSTKQKGHGLGLATCYAIVQKHDGCIDVESVMGKGSTFHVFLPASQHGTEQVVSQTPVSHKGSGRILILDDEPSIREILGSLLNGMGYTTLEAKDGEEALLRWTEAEDSGTHIDGAFFDLTIPGGMGGRETVVQLRKQYPNVPIYASSGYSEDPVMARPTEYGFTDSIRKPYRKDELATLLNRHPPMNSTRDSPP